MRRTALLVGAFSLALAGAPGIASAEDVSSLSEAPLIRKQLLLRGGRHEATASLGFSLGDAFVRGYSPTFGYQYYLYNWFGVGVEFSYNLCWILGDSCKTDLAIEIEAENPDLRGRKLEDLSVVTFTATPHVTLVPLTGKLGTFGATVVNWDTHIVIGAGLVGTDNLGSGKKIEAASTLAPVIGIGQRFYLGNSLAITLSLRDYVLSRKLNEATADGAAKGDGDETELENRFILHMGASFYFPPRVQTAR
jgi:outer membrane beta-barrel protein